LSEKRDISGVLKKENKTREKRGENRRICGFLKRRRQALSIKKPSDGKYYYGRKERGFSEGSM